MFKLKREILDKFCEMDKLRREYLDKMLMTDDKGEGDSYFHLAIIEEEKMKAIVHSYFGKEGIYAVSLAHDFVKTLGVKKLDQIIACLKVCEVEVV